MTTKNILIADDDRDLAASLALHCKNLGLTPHTTHDAMAAVQAIDALSPDVVILDVNMPGGNGLAVCELMFSGERLRNTPVIMLTGETDHDTVRRCHEMCAYYVLKCPDVWQRIEPLLKELLGENDSPSQATDRGTVRLAAGDIADAETNAPPSAPSRVTPSRTSGDNVLVDAVFAALAPGDLIAPDENAQSASADVDFSDELGESAPWVLCIDDDPDLSHSIQLRLREHGIAVRRAFAGMEGYRRAFVEPAQAIILDFEMPNGNGDYVLRRLKENPVTRDIPVIVLTGRREKSIERLMYNLGAAAFLTKPYVWNQLWTELCHHIDVPSSSNV